MTDLPHRVIPAGADILSRLSPWVAISHQFPSHALDSPPDELHRQMLKQRSHLGIEQGSRVAIAVGSRGISGLAELVAALVRTVREFGGSPFIVPAMGSHGGGTAAGQIALLASLGVTEEHVNAPVRSCMDTVRLGDVDGIDVHVDRIAATEADVVIPLARIKPHTDFRGPVESGILKMLAIGLGKHRGADSLHRVAPDGLSDVIAAAGTMVIESIPVRAGVAVIEDAYDKVAKIEVIPAAEIHGRETELLKVAASWMPFLPFDDVDVLIVGEIGKNISGPGMDPNITGRFYVPRPDARPNVGVLAVLSLTAQSHGNATGVGMADIVTRQMADSINWPATYTNEVAARMLAGPKLPLVAADEEDALAVAVHCLGVVTAQNARIAWIQNTLSLSKLYVSMPLWNEISDNPALRRIAQTAEKPHFVDGKLFVGATAPNLGH